MNYYELIDYLDIENGEQLRYFEEIAELIESDEYIDYEAIMQLFEEADSSAVAQLLDDYFNDITESLPEELGDIYSLLDRIRLELTGALRSNTDGDPETIRGITDRFYRFRNWYLYEAEVSVREKPAGETADSYAREYAQCVRDAIATARGARFTGGEYAFDFSAALDYDIDYYAMSFNDLIGSQYDDSDEEQLEQ